METVKKKFILREVHVRWAGIFILAFIMSLIYPTEEGESIIEKYFISLAFTAVFWNAAYRVFIIFRKKFPEIKQTPKRLLITVLTLAIIFVVLDPLLCTILHVQPASKSFSWEHLSLSIPVNLIAAAIVGSVYENVYFFEKWKKTIQLNESLKNQQIRTQFEVLQNQMSPHFLFNSLNTLTTLIAEDKQLAIDFTEKLSEVYRYILQNKEKELVSLKEELEFVNNYIFLLRIRYPQNLKVHFQVHKEFMSLSIAPLTVQILVENAIKHNVISKTHPLQIDIYVENGKSIVVKNNLQLKKTIEKSTKTGLANIEKRYAYLGTQNIDIITTANNFMIAIPLLSVVNDKAKISPYSISI